MSVESNAVTVSALARELDVPAGVVVERCRTLGIEATWSGAELGADDVARVRADLAVGGEAPAAGADDQPTDEAEEPSVSEPAEPAEPPAGGEPLPPTAAASLPSLLDPPPPAGPTGPGGPRPVVGAVEGEPDAVTPVRPRPHRRRRDRSVVPGLVGLAVAVVALGVAELPDAPLVVLGLWLVALVAALTAVVSGNRARYRITNHPEKASGLAGAVVALVGGALVLVAIVAGGYLAVRTPPHRDVAVLGGSHGVERLRWGYQRVRLVQDNGWHALAREAGTCWLEERGDDEHPEAPRRTDARLSRVDCDAPHTHEVLAVYAIDPRPDVAFDAAALERRALAACRAEWGEEAPLEGIYRLERPTEAGWDRGDHDVACLLVALSDRSVRDG